MLLAINIRNSFLELGIFDGDCLMHTCRISTDRTRTSDQYAILIRDVFAIEGYTFDKNTNSVMASVVPELSGVLKRAAKLLIGKEPFVIDEKAKEILGVGQMEMAENTVCNALYIREHYPLPAVLVDNGTTVKLVGVNENGKVAGYAFCAGIELTLKALTTATSQLPSIAFRAAPRAMGQTIEEALNAGVILGAASMIDGMINRFASELGGLNSVILTGKYTDVLPPLCEHEMIVNDYLALEGLRLVYGKLCEKADEK